jgi:hypothetical protein
MVGADAPAYKLPQPCAVRYQRRVDVRSEDDLRTALADARPGDLIALGDGRYTGAFDVHASGTPTAPIVLCGAATAVLDAGSVHVGTVLHLQGNHWIVSGFGIENGQRGIVLDAASHNRLTGLRVRRIGQEGVHLRSGSSHNVIDHCVIDQTGLVRAGFGEGIYVGSSHKHWASITGSASTPDRSDANRILYNTIGPSTAAENIDIKEGTRGGEIRFNVLLGRGLSGELHADAWVDLKGNDYYVEGNHGSFALHDGFQVHVLLPAWGHGHVFVGNVLEVHAPGFGFRIDSRSLDVVVACDNIVRSASGGLANVPCRAM